MSRVQSIVVDVCKLSAAAVQLLNANFRNCKAVSPPVDPSEGYQQPHSFAVVRMRECSTFFVFRSSPNYVERGAFGLPYKNPAVTAPSLAAA